MKDISKNYDKFKKLSFNGYNRTRTTPHNKSELHYKQIYLVNSGIERILNNVDEAQAHFWGIIFD